MATPKRIRKPNLTYHIYSRCADLKNLMELNEMKDLMIKVMGMAEKKYMFELINLAILDNHFHFIIRTVEDGVDISRLMQFIKSQYARRYNKKMNRKGPFWNERFGDTIIEMTENPEYTFHWINNYISYNSVRKNYVNDPRDYEYCFIKFYLDEKYESPLKLTHHEYFLKLGKTFKERVLRFLEFEEMYRKRIFPEYVFT